MTSAISRVRCGSRVPCADGTSFGSALRRRSRTRCDQMRNRGHVAVRRRRERCHHAGAAERGRARIALPPAFGDDVDDRCAPRHFSQSSLCRDGRRARRRIAATFAASSGTGLAMRIGAPGIVTCGLDHQPPKGNRARVAHQPCPRAAEQQIALAAAFAARPCSSRRSIRTRAVAACTSHGRRHSRSLRSAQNMRSRKRAESERMSWPRRLSRVGHGVRCISARSAASHVLPTAGIGQERRRHDRLDRRCRHRVVEHGGFMQRVGAVADRIRHAPVALRRAARAVVLLARARRKRARERLDAPASRRRSIAIAAMRTSACSSRRWPIGLPSSSLRATPSARHTSSRPV